MHFKRISKRAAALGMVIAVSMTNLSAVTATEPSVNIGTESSSGSVQDSGTVEKESDQVSGDVTGEGEKAGDEKQKIPQTEGTQTEGTQTEGGEVNKQDVNLLPGNSMKPGVPAPTPTEVPEVEQSAGLTGESEREAGAKTERKVNLVGEFADEKQKEYSVTVTGVDVKEGENLQVAVWSNDKAQDDLKWLKMEKQTDGSYKVSFRLEQFKSPGEYTLHVYIEKEDKSKNYVTGQRFQVDSVKGGKAVLEEHKYNEGTAKIKVSGVAAPSGITSVRVGVWSAADQSDMYWYTAKKEGSEWVIDMDIAKYHKNNWNKYTAHIYAKDGNGFEKYVDGLKVDFTAKTVAPEIMLDSKKKQGKITYKAEDVSVPGGFKSIRCAVWSEENGQDDIKWYTLSYDASSKSWSGDFSLKNLKSTGKSFAHAYLTKKNGAEIYLGGKEFQIDKPSLKTCTVDTNNETGDFTIKLSELNAPYGAKKVEVAVWCAENQSDMVWYTAKKSGDEYVVKSNISKHKYNVGNYKMHAYVTDELGIKTYANGKRVDFKCTVGDMTSQSDGKETSYTLKVDSVDYPAGLKEVSFGVWSTQNGQDDFKWYKATKNGNTYQATVDIKNHRTGGNYSVHVYGTTKAGTQNYLTGNDKMFTVKGSVSGSTKITDKNENKGTFRAVVSTGDVPSGIESVRIGVWSQNNQSDMHWYNAVKQDGNWVADIDVANHGYNAGDYNVHAYATMGNKIEAYVDGEIVKIAPKNLLHIVKGKEFSTRTIGITGPSNTSNLRFGVWSDKNGQDDVRWYTAKKTAGNVWTADIKGYDFKDPGTFSVHAYAGNECIATGAFHMDQDEVVKNGWMYEKLNGKTYKLYYDKGTMLKDVSGIIGRQSSYMAEINRTTCTVTIYAKDGANGYIIPVKAFTCSVGLPATPTPKGKFYTMAKYRWSELMGPSYGQYCTRIVGGILFHSVAGSNMTSYNLSAANYNMLGMPASHGCVRLCVRDAKWIYDNCSLGMEVNIFDSGYPGPFGKPATIKIPASQNWDPTDPNV